MNNNTRFVLSLIVLVVAIGLVIWLLSARGIISGNNSGGTSKNQNASAYKAVFLTNGQVYFGKLTSKNDQYVKLQDIYYLQLAEAPQPGNAQTDKDQQQISLVKLGQELHGPVDEMEINSDQILFIESMKKDAKVVEAITRYQKEGPTTSTPVTSSPAASPTK